MKTNEAPERLYLTLNVFGDIIKDQWQFHRLRDDDIEYTRTDAFVDKATEWQRKELCNYFDAPREDFERFIEDFKKAMKL